MSHLDWPAAVCNLELMVHLPMQTMAFPTSVNVIEILCLGAEIMSKIGELSIGGTDTDLWVLCATSQIPSQIASGEISDIR